MIKLTDTEGNTIYINPDWIISVGSVGDNKTTCIITMGYLINVQETVNEVASQIPLS